MLGAHDEWAGLKPALHGYGRALSTEGACERPERREPPAPVSVPGSGKLPLTFTILRRIRAGYLRSSGWTPKASAIHLPGGLLREPVSLYRQVSFLCFAFPTRYPLPAISAYAMALTYKTVSHARQNAVINSKTFSEDHHHV
jgi:hypothetical protein